MRLPRFVSVRRSIVDSRWSIVFILSFLFCVQGCATVYNPATGRREFIMISTPEEVELGKSVHQSIARQYKFPDSPAKLERVRRAGERLAKVSDRQDYQYHFYVIEDKEMNAFTTPGGNVYMYTGLLDKLTSDDQVAAVLAHEIGHCAARHTVKKFQAALEYDLARRIVLSQISGDQAKEITQLSTDAVMNIVFFLPYSRQDEFEADRLGIKYAYLACYDPRGSIETFKILEAGSHGPEVPLFLRSHPYIRDRIGMVEEEIRSVGRKYGPAPCGGLLNL